MSSNLNDLLNSSNIPLFSLDIETTASSPGGSKIWSLGLSNAQDKSKSFEHFFGDVLPEGNFKSIEEGLVEAHRLGGIEAFGKKQAETGSFAGYADASKKNQLTTVSKSIDQMTDILKASPAILLIQNKKFEDIQLTAALDRKGAQRLSSEARERFLSETQGLSPNQASAYSNQLFVTDKSIDQAYANLSSSHRTAMRSLDKSNDVDVMGVRKALSIQADELEKRITESLRGNIQQGKTTTLDLMHISTLYQSRLIAEGILPPEYLNYGRSVRFLSDVFLGQKELHEALSDAYQQNDLFKILTKNSENIRRHGSVGLSEEDRRYVKALKESDEIDKAFISNFKNRIEEQRGKGRQVDESFLKRSLTESLKNYEQLEERATFSREAYGNQVIERYLKNPDETLEKLIKDSGEEALEKTQMNIAGTEADRVAKKSKFNKRTAAMLGAVGLGAYMMSTPSKKENRQAFTSYDELYEDLYLGQAYADWQERNNAHKVLY